MKKTLLRIRLYFVTFFSLIFISFTSVSANSVSPSGLLDGRSFDVQMHSPGILGLFKSHGKLNFEDGRLFLIASKPVDKLPYYAEERNGKIYFEASGVTGYDGGMVEWKGLVNGSNLENVEGSWIRNINVSFFHDLLLPDVVSWVITTTPTNESIDNHMVLIPAGTFEMGNPSGESGEDNYPVHNVKIDSFYMDKYEVTVGQFKAFVEDTGYEASMNLWEKYFTSPKDNHPMVGVDWYAANAYAKWAGKRLPTEAEWEYAARGGLHGLKYPWGNTINHDNANYHRTLGEDITFDYPNYISTGRKDEWRYSSAPVGSFKPNGFGLYDMAGNVAEWCQDWYQRSYYSISPVTNPQGPETGGRKVSRGGHWFSWDLGLQVYNRESSPPDVKVWQDVQGFRLAADLD